MIFPTTNLWSKMDALFKLYTIKPANSEFGSAKCLISSFGQKILENQLSEKKETIQRFEDGTTISEEI
jgi:hypothetical protein